MVDIKPLEWVKFQGRTKLQIIEDEVNRDAVSYADMGDHVWVAKLNNRGTNLLCYGFARDDQNEWNVKLIPEDVGPDVYDCPITLLDMCVTRNVDWRAKVVAWHRDKKK